MKKREVDFIKRNRKEALVIQYCLSSHSISLFHMICALHLIL